MFQKIELWVAGNKLRIEGVLVLLALAGTFLKLGGAREADDLLMISLSALACFYFMAGRFMQKKQSRLANAVTQGTYLAFSVLTIGILFRILSLTGADEMILIGIFTMIAAGIVLLILWAASKDKKYIPLLLRIALFGIVTAVLATWA